MTSLILHVGPCKCGSSSIQQFFATQKKPCVQNIRYIPLNPLEIDEINTEKPSETIVATFAQLLSDNLIGYDVIILSHEYLFQCPYAVKNICNIAKNLATKISIIGYSRRQSDFLISAYSQWLFRSPDRILEATNALKKLELDPILFSGLERELIASIINDFYSTSQFSPLYSIFDWHNSYQQISQLIRDSGAVVKCGVLPNRESDISLVQDFCNKADITLRKNMEAVSKRVFNLGYNKDIVEAIYNAVDFGFDMPGPHESNEILELLSTKIDQATNDASDFLSDLKSYIDSYFLGSNLQFCQEYGLSKAYFAASVQFSKAEIMEIIINEKSTTSSWINQ